MNNNENLLFLEIKCFCIIIENMKPFVITLTVSLKFTLATGMQNFVNDSVMLLKNKMVVMGHF